MGLELPGSIAENVEQFTGRTWLLEPLLEWLTTSQERLFLLVGGPGTGKSMVMAWLAGAGPAPSGISPAEERSRSQLALFRSRVGGAHFCQATGGNIEPKLFAESLARQLTEKASGFDTALAASLSDRVQITSSQIFHGDVAASAAITGVTIGNLNLGDLGEEVSFNRVLREPLKRLYTDGFDEPLILLVDGLDEAATYTGAITIVQLLSRLADLPPKVRVLASTRPDPRILYLFPDVPRLDLIDDAPKDTDDVYDYASAQLVGLMAGQEAEALARRIADASEGVFLYAHLVLRDLLQDQPISADRALAPLPKGLGNLYVSALNRVLGSDRSRWYNTYRPLLGLIAVAQGDGLTQTQLARIRNTEVTEALEVVQQYLDGPFPQGPFRPFHRSFTELLHDPSNVAYGIPPGPMHWQVADHYWKQANGSAPWRHWDAYGIRYTATHLAEAALASDVPVQHQSAERLVQLMANPEFQQFHYQNVEDLSALQRDLDHAVASAARDSSVETLPLVPQSALALVTFRRQRLRPEPVFELAQRGEVQAAVRRLDLFEVDPDWYQASLLIIAWLAAGRSEAAALRDRVASDLRTTEPLPLLLVRLDQRMGGPKASFQPLPSPDPELARAIVERMAGIGANLNLLAAHGLDKPIVRGFTTSQELVSPLGYLARDEAPYLVAQAAHPDASGADRDRFLREYISLHTSYNYPVYRNGSLLWILAAVLRHPDDAWVEQLLPVLAEAALAGGGTDFNGAFPIGVLTWRARIGQPSATAELETRRQECLGGAARLGAGEGRDVWGRENRRLGALAEGLALLHGRTSDAEQLLQAALHIPYGFAGFRSAACLSLAESIYICTPHGAATDEAQTQALQAAHHIQDPSFLARSTARVNAIIQRWPFSATTSDALVQRLIDDPSSAEFSALHSVLDQYPLRTGSGVFPLDELLAADTLEALARIFQRPLPSFVRLNPGITPQQSLPAGTPLNVPDPGFPPRLAARFAAEILVDPTRPLEDRVRQIRALVPVAAIDPTALDALLGRLVLASAIANPGDTSLPDAFGQLADDSGYQWIDHDAPTVQLPS